MDAEYASAESTPVRDSFTDGRGVLRRRVLIVVTCAIVSGTAALLLSLTAPNHYTATSALLFRPAALPSAAQALLGSSSAPSSATADPSADEATDVQLVDLRTVDELTARAMGGGVTAGQVQGSVAVYPQGASSVVQITATSPRPNFSAAMANTFATEFVKFRRNIDSVAIVAAEQQARKLLSQLPPAQRTGSAGRALQSRAEDLSLVASLQAGNAEVVQTAIAPTAAASPEKARNTMVGVLVGLVLGGLVALMVEHFDRRLRSVDEMTSILRRPVIGLVPRSRAFAKSKVTLRPEDIEAFQLLRVNLRHFKPVLGEKPVILITSAQAGDGKSTVSRFLAAAAAVAGENVVMVDADLRHPGRHDESAGLKQVRGGKATLRDITIAVPARVGDATSAVTMDVIPAGPLRGNPAQLVSTDALAKVVAHCRAHYDFAVIDAPALMLAPDAVGLTQLVSGVLVVARVGRTERLLFRRLTERLELLNANVLGLVANEVEHVYGYGAVKKKKKKKKTMDWTDGATVGKGVGYGSFGSSGSARESATGGLGQYVSVTARDSIEAAGLPVRVFGVDPKTRRFDTGAWRSARRGGSAPPGQDPGT